MKNGSPDVPRQDRVFTIPNLLSLSRLILVVPFVLVLLARQPWSKPWAIVILLLAALTDKFDGMLARRLGAESEWGRILDPLADKIGIAVGSVVLLLLDLIPLWFVAALVARDVLIAAGGLYLKFKTGIVLPSNTVGKWSVGVFSVTLLCILLEAPAVAVDVLIFASLAMLVISLVMYVRRFLEVAFRPAGETSRGNV